MIPYGKVWSDTEPEPQFGLGVRIPSEKENLNYAR